VPVQRLTLSIGWTLRFIGFVADTGPDAGLFRLSDGGSIEQFERIEQWFLQEQESETPRLPLFA
jgi:hypothetical protein